MKWHTKYYDENGILQFAFGNNKLSLDKFNTEVKEKLWLIKLPTFKIIW